MNPRAIETRHPPREKPPIAWPSAPQRPAMRSNTIRSSNVVAISYQSVVHSPQSTVRSHLKVAYPNENQRRAPSLWTVDCGLQPRYSFLVNLAAFHYKTHSQQSRDV